MKIGIVLGTRPEIMKNYAIVKALRSLRVPHVILHTNQHHDVSMHQDHFALAHYCPDFVMPSPYSVGKAIEWVRQLIAEQSIRLLVVNGDTSTALAGAIATLYSDIRLAHVEAGLRAFDSDMIEERNRMMVDAVAHYLFTYTEFHASYLLQNRELRGRVINSGNTTIDLLEDYAAQLVNPQIGRYAYITLHRKEFTDDSRRMESTFQTLNDLKPFFDRLIFPMHPRTREYVRRYALPAQLLSDVAVIEPVSFVQSLIYQKYAALILTDSGCIQEEAYLLGVPCVTLRENTERIETVAAGANIVAGFDPAKIRAAVEQQLATKLTVLPPIYGAAGAGRRIVETLLQA
jgi:UDP-N-acetylglucosamine 2-epimerase (non-hydrolysing)